MSSKLKKYFVFVLICLPAIVFSQQSKIDSLRSLIKNDKEDSNKVKHSGKLCQEYINIGSYDTALIYGNTALEVAKQFNFLKGVASAYNNIAHIYYLKGNYSKTLDFLLKSLKTDEELKDKIGIKKNLGNIGNVYYRQGDYPKALDYDFKALKMAE